METKLIQQLFSNFEVNTIKKVNQKLNKEDLKDYLTTLFTQK